MTTQEILEAARGAKAALALADGTSRAQALCSMAAQLCSPANMTAILAANADDMSAAKGHISEVMLDRLALTEERIRAMAKGIEEVAALPDPVGRVLKRVERPNGLVIEKTAGGWALTTPSGIVETRYIINAAGISAQAVHDMAAPHKFTIQPTRGEYYLLDKSEGSRVHHVIFQCPNENGKGVLVAPTVHGNLIVGPNADPVEGDDTACTAAGLAFVSAAARRSVPNIRFSESIRNFAGVRANVDTGDFVIGEAEGAPGFIDLAGMKSPGLSSAPAVAREAVKILEAHGDLPAPKADYRDGRTRVRFKELPPEEKARLIAKEPAYGRVICRCETITEGEILDALHEEIPATTIDGVKRRCGAGMGRCQGGFCGPRVLELISKTLGIRPLDVLQDKAGTNVLLCETKQEGEHHD